jgi:hypothetical protein
MRAIASVTREAQLAAYGYVCFTSHELATRCTDHRQRLFDLERGVLVM